MRIPHPCADKGGIISVSKDVADIFKLQPRQVRAHCCVCGRVCVGCIRTRKQFSRSLCLERVAESLHCAKVDGSAGRDFALQDKVISTGSAAYRQKGQLLTNWAYWLLCDYLQDVVVSRVHPDEVAVELVELVFKDQVCIFCVCVSSYPHYPFVVATEPFFMPRIRGLVCIGKRGVITRVHSHTCTSGKGRANTRVHAHTRVSDKHVFLTHTSIPPQYIGRSDQWHLKGSIVGTCVHLRKNVQHAGMRATVEEIWANGRRCGGVYPPSL